MAEYFTYAQNLFVSPPHLPLPQSNLCKTIRLRSRPATKFHHLLQWIFRKRMTVNLEIFIPKSGKQCLLNNKW
jgi:hypothetical protein